MSMFQTLFVNLSGGFAYLFMMLTMISLWINRRIWIWGTLFVISLVLAYLGGVIDLKALIPIAVLFLCHASLTQQIGGFWRLFAVLIAAVISFGLLGHMVVGFHNIQLLQNWYSSPGAAPMTFYANFDKPIVAIFVLGLYVPLIKDVRKFSIVLVQSLLWMIITCTVLISLALYFNFIAYDPKIPAITLMWLILNLFFIAIPEEGFYRGFLQREITKDLNNYASGFLAITVVALLAGLGELFFVQNITYASLVFVANFLYGTIFFITGSIESAIIVHFLTNCTWFFFFTYPMFAK